MKYFKLVVLLLVGCLVGLLSSGPAHAAYLPSSCQGYSGKMICASKAQGRVMLVRSGRLVKSSKARFGGKASDGSGPWFTREGAHMVGYKQYNPVSTLYGVNMPFFVQFSGGQGIHYSSEFASGYPYSHGCIGLKRYKFAQRLYNFAYPGMTVVVTGG